MSIGAQLSLFANPEPAPVQRPADLPPVVGGRPEVVYRNPDNHNQAWTGRGKKPRWVTDWMEGGKSLEALRIPGTAP